MKWSLLTAVAVGVAGSAFGGPLKKADVPAEAAWLAHVDLEALRAGDLGRYILQRMNEGREKDQFAALAALLNFDIRTDLTSLTLMGGSARQEESGVVVRGRIDTERLAVYIRADPTHEEIGYRGQTVHSTIDRKKRDPQEDAAPADGKRSFMCSPQPGMVIFAGSVKAMQKMLDHLADGGTPNEDLVRAAPAADSGVILWGAADLKRSEGRQPKSKLLQQVSQGGLMLTEKGGRLEGSMRLSCADTNTAAQVQQMMQGLVALVQLGAAEDPGAAKLARGLKVEPADTGVSIRLDLPVPDAIEMLKNAEKQQKMKEQAKKEAGNAAAAAAEGK